MRNAFHIHLGRYPLSVGLQYGIISPTMDAALNNQETTIADVLHDNGYINYMIGKWHLGASSVCDLPTARGFDYHWGYLSGQVDYWSKLHPTYRKFKDMTYADKDCCYSYNAQDSTTYSTFLYRDKAVDIIETHDYSKNPMFLYLSLQAVHNPWIDDNGTYNTGIPESYVGSDVFNKIAATFQVSHCELTST